jgi:cupin fold WbuC family metalloprotein
VSGSAAVLTFEPNGKVLEKIVLSQCGPNVAIEIPGSTWLTIASLQPGTVLFEIKKGPYQPVTDKDFAAWAPAEGERAAERFVQWFVSAESGQMCPPL